MLIIVNRIQFPYYSSYRIGNERLSDWRSLYNAYYGNLLDSIYTGSDVLEACKCVNDELNRPKQ